MSSSVLLMIFVHLRKMFTVFVGSEASRELVVSILDLLAMKCLGDTVIGLAAENSAK